MRLQALDLRNRGIQIIVNMSSLSITFESQVDGKGSRLEASKKYYGEVLTTSADLQTNACTTAESPSAEVKAALKNVSDLVLSKYYGCGLIYPDVIKGKRLLDLGCGAGRDVYVLSQLVGEQGLVTGVDFTEAQLEVAMAEMTTHMDKFGFKETNVAFVYDNIENLTKISNSSQDVVVSNCVVNLATNKRKVLKEVYRVLKEGGEFYFSDVYATRRIPDDLRNDDELWGECISGALYWNDFLRLAKECGFADPRLVKSRELTINNPRLQEKLGGVCEFYSATYRLFKLSDLEPDCEDYGQAVVYKGTIHSCPAAFELDGHHKIETGKVFPVCGNTWRMLHDTRFQKHFDFIGDFSRHYGIFDGCGKSVPFTKAAAEGVTSGGSCC